MIFFTVYLVLQLPSISYICDWPIFQLSRRSAVFDNVNWVNHRPSKPAMSGDPYYSAAIQQYYADSPFAKPHDENADPKSRGSSLIETFLPPPPLRPPRRQASSVLWNAVTSVTNIAQERLADIVSLDFLKQYEGGSQTSFHKRRTFGVLFQKKYENATNATT